MQEVNKRLGCVVLSGDTNSHFVSNVKNTEDATASYPNINQN